MKVVLLIKITITVFVLALSSLGVASMANAATPDGGAVTAKYVASGGPGGSLGAPITAVRCGLVQGGCYQSYRSGSIYWSASSGAQIIRGGIRGRWAANGWEKGVLGYPLNAENCTLVAKGCYQKFQWGTIYWQSAVGAHAVQGGIRTKFGQMGWENSPLGYPRTDEACVGTIARTCTQQFQLGTIVWKSGHGISVTPAGGSIGVVVNKRRPNSPVNRTPTDLVATGTALMRREASAALDRLMNTSANAGAPMNTVSGFRSYATQVGLYNSYVAQYGQATADTISARPGFSEHQTGLVMDIGNPNAACALSACFANTPAGAYAAANAWRYGFIIRYPNGYTDITGYAYEPWHLRYVGVYVSTDMHNRGFRTLEQYFGLSAAPSY